MLDRGRKAGPFFYMGIILQSKNDSLTTSVDFKLHFRVFGILNIAVNQIK